MSEKIKAQHLARKAILYVRQSSAHQVSHNLESQKLQYAMQERLTQLGWHEIEVVDEDLGRSAAGTVNRTGFERMVSEVCLGKVGAVAAREVSRFARNSREWQQLVEVCRVVDTVLVDQETVYAPRQSNDRLLLGLKGSLNEYELDLLRQRSLEARREKAKRGELIVAAPVGYLKAEQRLEKDPGPSGPRSRRTGVSQVHGTGQRQTDSVVVSGARIDASGANPTPGAALETAFLWHALLHAHPPSLCRRVRLRQDRAAHTIRGWPAAAESAT